ncbi:hypothetical protein PF005_g3587 [Phytophthora fragariae]|nr:hypothetical protein PF003_g23957 [Phytophthora fragariae]KAE9230138.1 hypothetical protein PF005_g3587 [Phytophthora fragariae]KAE9323073.1 hypothetical protein PF001_g4089 [Phytophthora fragariae]
MALSIATCCVSICWSCRKVVVSGTIIDAPSGKRACATAMYLCEASPASTCCSLRNAATSGICSWIRDPLTRRSVVCASGFRT